MNKILKIDEELRDLLPPLSKEEFELLEQNIKDSGCIDPIIIWNDYIVDGHNRYEICNKHNILFQIVTLAFNSKDDVMDWMIDTQLGRRNITLEQKSYLRGLQYEREKKKLGDAKRFNQSNGQKLPTERTSERLAEQHKVAERTIREDARYAKAVDRIADTIGSEAKNKILTKEKLISKKDVIEIGEQLNENKVDVEKLKENFFESEEKKINIKPIIEVKPIEKTLETKEIASETSLEDNINKIVKDLKTPKFVEIKINFFEELDCFYDNVSDFIDTINEILFERYDTEKLMTNDVKIKALDCTKKIIDKVTILNNKINSINIKENN